MRLGLLLFLSLLCLVGCLGVVSVAIEPSEVQSMYIGQTQQFSAEFSSAGANDGVIWTASNNELGYISSTGLFSAKGVGAVDVIAPSATDKTVSDKVAITILILKPTSISITPAVTTMVVNDALRFQATALPENANDHVIWSVSDSGLGSITVAEVFNAESQGTVDIIATSVVDPIVSAKQSIIITPLLSPLTVVSALDAIGKTGTIPFSVTIPGESGAIKC